MALLTLLSAACMAEEERPRCTSLIRGRFWPEQANWDRAASRRAEQCGELMICTQRAWRYRWEPLTVHVSQLGTGPQRAIPGCQTNTTTARR